MGNSLASINIEEMLQLASEVAKSLEEGDVVCLRGDLGVGKTTFAKGLISALIPEISLDDVTSPTYVTMNLYKNVAHFDLYRLENMESFSQSGFHEYLEQPYIAIVEWPEVIETLLPKKSLNFTIERQGDGLRKIH